MEKIERRAVSEIRANVKSREISGTAIVFNKESQLLDSFFREIIHPEAVTQEILDKSDILMTVVLQLP